MPATRWPQPRSTRIRRTILAQTWLRSRFMTRSGFQRTTEIECELRYFRGPAPAPSLPRLIEISRVRRRLVLAGRHQQTIRAHEIILLADRELLVVLAAIILGPVRTRILIAHVFLVDGPRSRQGMVDHGNFVMKDVGIDLVAVEPLLEDGL